MTMKVDKPTKRYIQQRQDHWRARGIKLNGEQFTWEDFEKAVNAQFGECGICGKKLGLKLHADHEHNTGEFRGCLCNTCNLKSKNLEEAYAYYKYMLRGPVFHVEKQFEL